MARNFPYGLSPSELPSPRPYRKYMVSITGVWSIDEITTFLEATTVPIRLGCRTPTDDPWMLSLWYRYVEDEFECATAADADVIRFIEYDPVISFEISTNEPPYRGVRGRGKARVESDDEKVVLRSLIERYLGDTDSVLAQRLLAPDRNEVTITVVPERLHSWDYSHRMSVSTD